jgi:hypothetical protein
VIDTHGAVLPAVQEHSRETVTLTVPVPPPDAKDVVELVTAAWQRVSEGAVTLADVDAELPHAAVSAAARTAAI